MSGKDVGVKGANELVVDSLRFESFLEGLNLPTDNIIADTEERRIVGENLPQFLNSVDESDKNDARYLSKFVGATAIGLFDAALNYVWNEVVINLRKKAGMYGVNTFFDAAVGGKNRELYQTEEDLSGLKDQVLLDTCRKLELISNVVYEKLAHILTMRNQVAASHPNVESIGGYELLGWLQTCVKDVIQDNPSESAIQIKSIIQTLRTTNDPLDATNLKHFVKGLKDLSTAHIHNLLITLFGMFLDETSSQVLRKNVSELAKPIWSHSLDHVKVKLASRIDTYRTNLQEDKIQRAKEFLASVDGLSYESLPTRTIVLDELASRLRDAHAGWDNFYNEPPIAREVMSYIKNVNDIPSEVKEPLVWTFLKCRVGNGVKYSGGVSSAGKPLYDRFLKLLDDDGVALCIIYLTRPEFTALYHKNMSLNNVHETLALVRPNIISERLSEAVDLVLADARILAKSKADRTLMALLEPWVK